MRIIFGWIILILAFVIGYYRENIKIFFNLVPFRDNRN